MKHMLGVALSVFALLPGCAIESGPDSDMDNRHEPGQVDEEGRVGETSQSVAVLDGEFSWRQEDGEALTIGSASDRFCFLTSISGRFKGAGEHVSVFVQDGKWKLGGGSLQTGVNARARCVPLTWAGHSYSYTDDMGWSQGNNATALGSDSNRTCFLTSVRGHFEGAGERVEIFRSGGNWQLGGSSNQQGVEALARCLINAPPSATFTWRQEDGSRGVLMGSMTTTACGLTRMTGRFAGAGESVSVVAEEGNWRLRGTSNQAAVAGSGVCAL